jgi:predicted RecB family nuclease
MRKNKDGSLIYSPSDLIVFMESEFASWMDRFYAEFPGDLSPDSNDPSLQILRALGIEHEKNYLQKLKTSGLDVIEIGDGPSAHAETLKAMSHGHDVIYQGELRNEHFTGRSDFLLKTAGQSKLGDYHYEVWDTKLSRKPKPYFLIQLCCYAEMLEVLQGRLPVSIGIVLGDLTEKRFKTADYLYYYRQLKQSFQEQQSIFNHKTRPIPNGMAEHGRWSSLAEQVLEDIDHLGRVANIRRVQIRKLERALIQTSTDLANTELVHVAKMEPTTLAMLRTQARLQLESSGLDCPKFELIELTDEPTRRGLRLLPPSSQNDLFFDLEGYPYIEGGLEYLFGASFLENGKLEFKSFWAHDRQQEKKAFEDFVDWAYQRWQEDPTMHIYHYADYEISALRRLMGRHATREREVDVLLRNEVFINLFTVVRQSMYVGTPSYSIKKIELLYREKRDTEVSTAMDSVVFYHNWLELQDGLDPDSSEILRQIRDYNKDDCDSTLQLASWLREVQVTNNIEWIPPVAKSEGSSNSMAEARSQSAALAQELLSTLPDDLEEARVQALLGHLLEFHWRESKPVFWAKYDRHDMTEDQLIDEPNCLGGLQRTTRAPEAVKRSMAYEYSFDPSQDTKLGEGSKCFFSHDLRMKTEIVKLDDENGLVEIKIGAKALVPPDRIGLIPDEFVDPEVLAASIFRIVSHWRVTGILPAAVNDLLRRSRPRFKNNENGPIVKTADTLRGIIDAVRALDGSTLCIQGPPGTGKTYTAAKIIVDLLQNGHRVGVTSNSHKAIAKLLKDVEAEASSVNFKLKGSKIQSEIEDFGLDVDGTSFAASTSVDYVFGTGRTRFQLIGGTAWTFSDEAAVGGVDYLFVDEGGQVSLANLLAMAPSTKNIILMGDQMQLSQPIKGAHPGESGQSSLQYLLQEKQTIADDFGIFLPTTFRMHPDLCKFISGAVYEGKLQSDERTLRRRIVKPSGFNGRLSKCSGVLYLPVDHDGNTQCSDEEAEAIAQLIEEVLCCKLEENGIERPLTERDILLVAPYNMQARLLKSKHHRDYVGTVDKFQGQEAPIVILSMCASDGNESARGAEFLFNKNRLNVAISRAQCLAIVVGSPRLARTECHRLEQMERVNLYCRIVEEGSAQDAFAPVGVNP